MPLHDVGYRRWKGQERGYAMRWFAITNKGFEIALRSQIVRRMMFLAWLPALYFGAGIFFFESYVERSVVAQLRDVSEDVKKAATQVMEANPEKFPQGLRDAIPFVEAEFQEQTRRQLRRSQIGQFLRMLGEDGSEKVFDSMLQDDDRVRRRTVWSFLLLKFLRGPQGFALILLIGWVAAPLIAKDLRTKAFLLYFSRPLTKANYILGKLMILVILSMVITTLPAFILYFVGIGLSPNLNALEQTWDLPVRLVVVSLLHIVPASLLALMFSSLTTDSRFAHFSWYATWILGYATWGLISTVINTNFGNPDGPPQLMRHIPLSEGGAWAYVSIYHTINMAQGWAMGTTDHPMESFWAFCILGLMSAVCLLVTWYRVSKAVLL